MTSGFARSTKKAKARPRRTPGVMNKTERRFEANVLKPLLWAGEIESYEYEAIKFRYGPDWKATYTPDFIVTRKDGQIECVDVKGSAGWEEATRNKIKACAEKFWQYHWVGQVEAKRSLGSFTREDF